MREGATRNLEECLKMEYGMACRMMETPDFLEGVRSVIVDKVRCVCACMVFICWLVGWLVGLASKSFGKRHVGIGTIR